MAMGMFTYHQLKHQECTLLACISETGRLELRELMIHYKRTILKGKCNTEQMYLQVTFHMVYC